jgi:starvation-inducible DNA-binding protein
MEELVASLKRVQANVAFMYTKAHGYHWNVEGILFKQFHAFFLEIYEDVYSSLDTFSENLRRLGVYAPYKMMDWMGNSNMNYEDLSTSPIPMLQSLEATNLVMLDSLNDLFTKANAAGEQGLCNFVAERIDQHKFWDWQIKASLKATLS